MICIQSNLPISDSALPTRGRGRGPRGNWLIKTRNRHILTKYWTISANRNENNKDKTITVIGVQFSSLNSISRGMKNTSVYGTRLNSNGRLTWRMCSIHRIFNVDPRALQRLVVIKEKGIDDFPLYKLHYEFFPARPPPTGIKFKNKWHQKFAEKDLFICPLPEISRKSG